MKKTALVAVALMVLALLPTHSFAGSKSSPSASGGAVAIGLFALFGGFSHAAKPTETTTEFSYLNNLPLDKSLMNQAASGAMNTDQILNQ